MPNIEELMAKYNTIRATIYTSIEHNLDEGSEALHKVQDLANECKLTMKRNEILPAHIIFMQTCSHGESAFYNLKTETLVQIPGTSLIFKPMELKWEPPPERSTWLRSPYVPMWF